MALRLNPSNDCDSVEMLTLSPDKRYDGSRTWQSKDPTLRQRLLASAFPWKPFLIISILPFAMSPIVILSRLAEQTSQNYLRNRDCYPNGLWKEQPDATWRIMDSSYFFTPNLSFGSMTFTQVKVIDIAWDLLVGRGGQLLLAWVNYKVFNEWLYFHMEFHKTSYKMFTMIAFSTTSLATLGVLGKEFLAFGKGTWRRFFRWLGIICMLLSTVYVISFPTLMAAMTGYIATSEAYIKDTDGNLVNWNKVDDFGNRVEGVIYDASRIGNYSKTLVCLQNDTTLLTAMTDYWKREHTGPGIPANHASVWIFDGETIELEAPALDLHLGDDEGWFVPYGEMDRFYVTTHNRQADLLPRKYILENGSCKPGETYQWGFSYIFLFMISIFNFVWSCIMIGIWMDTSRNSRMYKSGRRPGLLRAILDISGAMREEIGEEHETLVEDELRNKLREGGGTVIVSHQELRVTRAEIGGGRVKKRGWRRALTKGSTF